MESKKKERKENKLIYTENILVVARGEESWGVGKMSEMSQKGTERSYSAFSENTSKRFVISFEPLEQSLL